MTRSLSLLFAFAIAISAANAHAQERAARRVYVGVYLHDISRIELRDGVFDVDFDMWAKWRGEFDTDELQIANASDVEITTLGTESDGEWHTARWRARGTLRGEFPLRRFPYDQQELAVILELPERHGLLLPDAAGSGMAARFAVTDWLYDQLFRTEVEERTVASDLGLLEREGLPTEVRRVSFSLVMHRPIQLVALKLFLPLAIILLVAFVALFIEPTNIEARSSIGVTALLSCFAFQFTVADSLPQVTYLTFADALFLIGYVVTTLCLAESVWAHALARDGKEDWLDRMDGVARIGLPVATALAVLLAFPETIPDPPAPGPAPVPEMSRPRENAREVLRIGSTRLRSLLSSPIYRAVSWSATHTAPPREGEETPETERDIWPVHVERLPGVDNELVRFLASGELEARWVLREEIRWSDGTPVSMADLLLPHEAVREEHIVAQEATDDRTLRIRWDGRLAAALEGIDIWPSAALRQVYDEEGYDGVRARRRVEALPSLGPYRVESFVPGERAILLRNEHFVGPAASFPRVEVLGYEDGEALRAAFEAGEVDITYPNHVSMEDALAVRAERPGAAHIRPSATFVYLIPDMQHPALRQRRVRQAIMQAIDRVALSHEAYGDAGRVAHAPVRAPLPVGTRQWEHDVEAARETLREASVGSLRIPLFYREIASNVAFIERVQQDLEAIGIDVDPTPADDLLDRKRSGDHGGLLLYVSRGSRSVDPRRFWNVPLVEGNYPDDYRDDAYDDSVHDLVQRERHALYPERRAQLRERLLAEIGERLPIIPLVFAAERVLADPRLRGWDVNSGELFGDGLEAWYFEPGT